MDRFESMAAYVAVVEGGGLSAAARALKQPVATISRKVAQLEEHLSTQLLYRTTRRVTPTPDGESFYRDCRRILDELKQAEEAAAGRQTDAKGELTITAPDVFGRLHVAPLVAEFLISYRRMEINLVLADHILDLQDERLDLAIRIGLLPDSALTALRVGEVRPVICASPSYLEARGMPKHPSELHSHDCITARNAAAKGTWTFKEAGETIAVPVYPRLTVNSSEAAIAAAIAGFGLVRSLSYQVAEPIAQGRLKLLLVDYASDSMPVSLVHIAGRMPSRNLRSFIDFIAPKLKARLADIEND